MSGRELADLSPAPDGGPPVRVERRLLDQVPYATTIGPVRLLEAHLSIRCQDADLGRFLAAFVALFPPVAGPAMALDLVEVGGRWGAYQDGGRALWAPTVPGLARSLVWLLNALALQAPSPDVHVHAAVAGRHGRAVIFPGRSGAGKTTLVAALSLDGWDYLSDEVAALDLHGDVVRPYPRPLALEQGSWAMFPDAGDRWPDDVPELVTDLRLLLPATLGTSAPPEPARPAAIVFPEVVAGATTALHPIGRAEALERLVSLTFNLGALGAPGFQGLARAVAGSSCRRLVLDGVRSAPALVGELLDELSES
ncbi:MAG: hypothetical protein ACR2MO_17635 [Acidimicrobiales bacterium]